jgi:hypothetical protein
MLIQSSLLSLLLSNHSIMLVELKSKKLIASYKLDAIPNTCTTANNPISVFDGYIPT